MLNEAYVKSSVWYFYIFTILCMLGSSLRRMELWKFQLWKHSTYILSSSDKRRMMRSISIKFDNSLYIISYWSGEYGFTLFLFHPLLIILLDVKNIMITRKSLSKSFNDSLWHHINVLISYIWWLLHVFDSLVAFKVIW